MIFSIFLLWKNRPQIGNSIESAVNKKSSDFETLYMYIYIHMSAVIKITIISPVIHL